MPDVLASTELDRALRRDTVVLRPIIIPDCGGVDRRSTNDGAVHNYCSRFPSCDEALDVLLHHFHVDETVGSQL